MTIIGACLSPNTQEQRDSTDLAWYLWRADFQPQMLPSRWCHFKWWCVERREKIQCMQASYLVCSLQI
jgi:fructose-1,6-bisphosphatase